jgi:hypothetical protein
MFRIVIVILIYHRHKPVDLIYINVWACTNTRRNLLRRLKEVQKAVTGSFDFQCVPNFAACELVHDYPDTFPMSSMSSSES